MKIGVLLKEVPDTESIIRVADDGLSLSLDRIQWIINPYDEIALEEALRLKERSGGPSATASPEACRADEVVVVTAGPARAEESMRRALAVGADRGIRIDADSLLCDPAVTAGLIADVARRESFDIIFAGKVSFDGGWGQVHIGVAELLGMPHASPAEVFEYSAAGARVVRAAESGVKERIMLSLPAVVGCERGLNEPRYATLPGIIKARSKRIEVVQPQGSIEASVLLERLSPPPERKRGRLIEGAPAEAARRLAAMLREEARVI